MNGFATFFVFAQGSLSSINWLWVLGGVAAVWILISAMGRRQTRLTEVLREHVDQHNRAHKPPEIDEPKSE